MRARLVRRPLTALATSLRDALRLGLVSWVVLLLALGVTAVGYVVVREDVEKAENRILEERARQLAVLFESFANQTQTMLAAAAAVAEATGGDGESFRAAMAPRVRKSLLSSIALVRVSSTDLAVIAEVGSDKLLFASLDAQARRRLREIATAGRLGLVEVTAIGGQRVVGFATSPRAGSDYAVYAEARVPDVSRLAAALRPGDLEYAFYAGTDIATAELLATNARGLPIRGRRVAKALRIGSGKTLLVIGTRGRLVGLAAAAPFVALGFGLAGALVFTALVETRRRRDATLHLAMQLKQKNAELGQAIATQQQVERELRASEERYRSLVELTPDTIAIHRGGRIVFVNRAGLELLGAERVEDLLDKPVLDLVHPDFHLLVEERMKQVILDRSSAPFIEERFVRLDGTTIDVEVASLPASFDGEPAAQLIVRDIAERKRAEEERRRLEERLRQSQKMEAVGQLAGGVAHDFNNLLTVIGGYAEILLRELLDDGASRDAVEEIVRAADHASALTRQLLTFSRKHVVAPRFVDVNEIVSELEKMLRRLIRDDIDLVAVLDSRVGKVHADPVQLEQVLVNLVVNASDAMPDGGTVRIETSAVEFGDHSAAAYLDLRPGRYIVLSVSDDGIGMDAETRARVFEPFFTTKEFGKGTGIGLATVYAAVTQCGGRISVYSEPRQGTTFKVYLPEAVDIVEERRMSEISAPSHGSETVLVVEDNERLRRLACRVLAASGYRVVEASRPAEALETMKGLAEPVDLLVTDVVMPEMSGRTLAETLRPERPHMRVLYISGYTEGKLEHEGVLEQHIAFLQKPFSPDELTRAVRATLDAAETQADCGSEAA